jgi:hypothetical protein
VLDAIGKHPNCDVRQYFFTTADTANRQSWARALMSHPQSPAGIRYNPRENPRGINYAVFGLSAAKSAGWLVNRYPLVDYSKSFRLLFQYDFDVV